MTTKAEELAQLIAAEVGRLLPDETPVNMRAMAEKTLANGLQNAIEQYGRLVQEAAANIANAKSIDARNAYSPDAEYYCDEVRDDILRMPLP